MGSSYSGPTIISGGTLQLQGLVVNQAQAYQITTNVNGNQNWSGPLGYDFTVNKPITITQFGAYDSGQDGLSNAKTVSIYPLGGGAVLATTTVPGGTGATLLNGYRFVPISSLALSSGNYTLVAVGFGADANFNSMSSSTAAGPTDSGGGALSFFGQSRYGMPGDGYPGSNDSGPAYRYGAGSFVFTYTSPGAGSNVLPTGTNVAIASGATLDLTSVNQTLAGLSGKGSVIGTGALTVTGAVSPGDLSGAGTLTVSNLTLLGGSALTFDLSALLVANDKIVVTGGNALAINGPVTVNLNNLGGLENGTYVLLDYAGAPLGGTPFGYLGIGAAPSGTPFSYTLVNDLGNSSVDLLVEFIPEPATLALLALGGLALLRRRR